MSELDKGITPHGEGFGGVEWSVLGQRYFPKAECESAFAFETNSEPGQFVPVHIHATQDKFILVQEGELDVKLDGLEDVGEAVRISAEHDVDFLLPEANE